jgi:6-phosphogluconolactonase
MFMHKTLFTLIFLLSMMAENFAQKKDVNLFVGTYTRKEGHVDGKGEGIYGLHCDPKKGTLTIENTARGIINPSYIALSNDKKFIFAVEEIALDTTRAGMVTAFRVKGNELERINSLTSIGNAPCHVSATKSGKYIFVANYSSGTVVMHRVGADGTLIGDDMSSPVSYFTGSSITTRQQSSHPHSAVLSPDEKFLYVPDLGTDIINIFSVNEAQGSMDFVREVPVTAGAGPRHLVFHPTKPLAYVVNELNNSVTAFKFSPSDGNLTAFQSINTLPDGTDGSNNLCADIHITPNGNFLYASNRGHDSLAGYAIQPDGSLKFVSNTPIQGKFPRNFAIHPSGKRLYVANQNSDNIVLFDIKKDGKLVFKTTTAVKTPVCLIFK